jgi:hypothetical protein
MTEQDENAMMHKKIDKKVVNFFMCLNFDSR